MKLLLPWQLDEDEADCDSKYEYYYRWTLDRKTIAASIHHNRKNKWYVGIGIEKFNSFEEAAKYYDAKLLGCGFKLLSKDEAEKLGILL